MNIANIITLSRLALAFPILIMFYRNTQFGYVISLALFAVALISDMLDGFVARRYNQITEIGAKLDPLVDKIMIHSLLFSLFYVGVFNPALVLGMFFRDMIVDGIRNIASERSANCGSNVWGKAKFALQSLAACSGLAYCIDPSYQEWMWLANITLAAALFVSMPGMLTVFFRLQHLETPLPSPRLSRLLKSRAANSYSPRREAA